METFKQTKLLDQSKPLPDQIAKFIHSDSLKALLGHFGYSNFGDLSLIEELQVLENWMNRWDFRGGLERDLSKAPSFTSDESDLIFNVANSLGLITATLPKYQYYDCVLVLGGLIRACFNRPTAAEKFISNKIINSTDIVALGGFRELSSGEKKIADSIGYSHLNNEFVAMEAGLKRAFNINDTNCEEFGDDSELIGGTWKIKTLQTSGVKIQVIAAPSSEPNKRRANTADTYKWFAKNIYDLKPGIKLLLITSTIYLPYQHAVALKELHIPYGIEIDTVGFSLPELEEPLKQTFLPHNYLQELKSAITSYRQLLETINNIS